MTQKNKARCFGQDLMRGEHIVGGQSVSNSKVSPGGSPGAATRLQNGHTVRGDGVGKPMSNTEKYDPADGWRSTGLTFASGTPRRDEVSLKLQETSSGTSIFDPVLCELAYTWFCPPGGAILDPFAGGSVRGIVAAYLGRHYTGVDLRQEQIEANEEQARAVVPDNTPCWIVGDSREVLPDGLFDFVFSCPPYADLEVYSDDPRDISTMEYNDFLEAYRDIITKSIERLKDNRFACFVVGDVRDRKGLYRNFVGDTVAAFRDAGAMLYNDAVLVTAVGSLPIRVGKQFESGRKLGKTHQNVLVFVKGDWREAAKACGDIHVMDLCGADEV